MGGLAAAVGGCVGCGWVVSFVVVFVFLWRWFWCSTVGVLVWDGGGWDVGGGIHGCWQRGWAVSCGGGGWFFYFVFLYIVGFFNVILILKYIILMYRIEE